MMCIEQVVRSYARPLVLCLSSRAGFESIDGDTDRRQTGRAIESIAALCVVERYKFGRDGLIFAGWCASTVVVSSSRDLDPNGGLLGPFPTYKEPPQLGLPHVSQVMPKVREYWWVCQSHFRVHCWEDEPPQQAHSVDFGCASRAIGPQGEYVRVSHARVLRHNPS
ncbi:hypothetical protein PM082_021692 [Marasmius tenuissimus]|nr:hypothetical protein PM082_021692 [Marasmius tenuissimus]